MASSELDALYGDVSGNDTKQGEGALGGEAELGADKEKGLEDAYQTYQPSRQEPTQETKAQDPSPTSTSAEPGGSVSVYIGNLQWWTTDAEIETACSDCGKIKSIKFFEEKSNGKSKGYVLVTFVDAAGALACQKKVHGLELNGKPIVAALQHQQKQGQRQSAYGGQNAGGPVGRGGHHHHQQQRSYGSPYGRGRGYAPRGRGGGGYQGRPYGGRGGYGRGAPRQYGNRYE